MLPIIVILFVAYIIIPAIELVAKEAAQYFAKVIIYALAFLYVVWLVFFTAHGAGYAP